jgi:hypothetical protein
MRNPWTTKNPFMSMWLSSANKVMGSARGHATAAAKRQVTAIQAETAKQVIDFWSGKTATKAVAKKKTKRR